MPVLKRVSYIHCGYKKHSLGVYIYTGETFCRILQDIVMLLYNIWAFCYIVVVPAIRMERPVGHTKLAISVHFDHCEQCSKCKGLYSDQFKVEHLMLEHVDCHSPAEHLVHI